MMSLQVELANVLEGFKQTAPDAAKAPIIAAKSDIEATFDRKAAIQEGDRLPDFKLPNATGEDVTSKELLAKGPIL